MRLNSILRSLKTPSLGVFSQENLLAAPAHSYVVCRSQQPRQWTVSAFSPAAFASPIVFVGLPRAMPGE
jgi:hypothetical protein